MGMFSWIFSDTDKPLELGGEGYLLIPEEYGGGYIHETNYGCDGIFGGQNVFELEKEWNKNGKTYPIKITQKPMTYENAEASYKDPWQGTGVEIFPFKEIELNDFGKAKKHDMESSQP